MTARSSTCAAVLGAALAGAGFAAAGHAQAASSARVRIKDIDFSPHRLVVKRGTTVRWTFEDEATPHNVTSRGKTRFKSSTTKQAGSYRVRFTKSGTYRYVCTIHFNMKGTIVVR